MSPWADEFLKLAGEQWLEVESYRSKGKRGELLVKARGKRLWFPMSVPAYQEFKKRLVDSQADAFAYAKQHVRSKAQVQPYKGEWRGAGSSYYRKNKLPTLSFERKKEWDVGDAQRVFKEKRAGLLPVVAGLSLAGLGANALHTAVMKRVRKARRPLRPIEYGKYA